MSILDEKMNAIIRSRQLLRSLLDRSATPKVPLVIREEAKSVLRHFPFSTDVYVSPDQPTKAELEAMKVLAKRCLLYKFEHEK